MINKTVRSCIGADVDSDYFLVRTDKIIKDKLKDKRKGRREEQTYNFEEFE